MNYKHHVLQSPFGWIGLLGSDKGLRRLSLRPGFQEALGGAGAGTGRVGQRTPRVRRGGGLAGEVLQGGGRHL